MKSKLFLLLFCSSFVFAQAPITSYFGTTNYTYANINPSTPINHTATGANVVWNFNFLGTNSISLESNIAPTALELTTYPTTNSVHVVSTNAPSPGNSAKIYSNTSLANAFSFTGFDANGIILNYATNNATLGTLPFNYGLNNTDTTGGTFIFDTNSGTFAGTILTSYDSYGTLNLAVTGYAPITRNAFRVKVVQNINLSVGFPVGTLLQTTYTYYVNDGGIIKPLFRDTTYTINVPLLGINQTTNQAQVFQNQLTLSTSDFDSLSKSILIYPNPASNILNIENKDTISLVAMSITDCNGRTVLQTNKISPSIDISNLLKGIYFVNLLSNQGKVTKKLVKQ